VHRRDQDWREPPTAWVRGSACDAWLLRYESLDPLTYAAQWNQSLRASDPADYAAALDRWLAYYRRRGIEAIAFGAVVLRRRAAPAGGNWVRSAEAAHGPAGAAGAQIRRVFAAQDFLAGLAPGEADGALLAAPLRPADRHRLEQTLIYRDGAYAVRDAALVLDEGVGLRGAVDLRALHVLLRLDGRRALGGLLDEAFEATGLDAAALRAAVLETTSRLFADGFLVRGSGAA
jgi:hypothetical protein